MSFRSGTPAFVLSAILLTFFAGCGREEPAPATPPAADPASTEPAQSSVQQEPATPAPPAETPAETDSVTGFHGFGPAKFGDDEESVRIAWGRPMEFDRVATADAPCAYLMPDPAPSDEFAIAFMFEGGKFVRYDVEGTQYEAPGSGRVGNMRDALEALYAGRFEMQPHKYIEGGQNFIVVGPEGGDTKLIFEIDAGGKVTSWRVGRPPQVDYVEGCS
jgi:hypothetical protein